MKNIIKWVFTHEPALLAGFIAAVAVFFAFRYGTGASGDVQGLSAGVVAGIFGTLRNFVTSPAGRKALDTAQADISMLPRLVSDVAQAKDVLEPAIKHPKGLIGVLEDHEGQLRKITKDTVDVVRGMIRASAPKVPAADVPTVTYTNANPSKPLVTYVPSVSPAVEPAAPEAEAEAEPAQTDPVEAPAPVVDEPIEPPVSDVPPEVAELGKLLGKPA